MISDSKSSLNSPASPTEPGNPSGTCALIRDGLHLEGITRSARDDAAGIVAMLIGVARNSFQGA